MTDHMTAQPMPDQPDGRPAVGQDVAGVTIEQAAALLGLSPDGVRSRLRRGKLAGERTGRTWVVFLTADSGQPVNERAPDRPADRPPDQSSVLGHPTNASGGTSPAATRDALVARLEADVDFLQAELERRSVELAEQRRLLAGAQQQIAELVRALPAPQEMPATRPETPENGPDVVELVQTPPAPGSLSQALKDAGVRGKKTRRRLLARLSAAWRGE